MLAPLSWIREYVNLPTVDKLVDRLNQTGTTVAAVTPYGEGLEKIIVGEILEISPHPNADKLQLTRVQVPGKILSVVCGAKNIAAGQKVPVALVGTSVPVGKDGSPLKIEKVKIRNVESAGMLCSAKELGLGEDHSGILVLDPNLKVGTKLTTALNLPDTVVETEVTTNRGDELSIYGLAREISAVTGATLKPLTAPKLPTKINSPIKLTATIADPALCTRYSALAISGLKLGPSPVFIQTRLRSAGMRPINNLVDITNYVLLLTGQPLHAFDYSKIAEGHLIVRESQAGERLTTLDGVTRQLGFGAAVIADQGKILGLAGVMGGEHSGVGELTDTVVLESAVFDPGVIRQTALKYNLPSEASFRFVRGVDPTSSVVALELAVQLLAKYAGGQVASELVDIYPKTLEPVKVELTSAKMDQYLGFKHPLSLAASQLVKLGFKVVARSSSKLTVQVPSWRMGDVSAEEDLIEEVARLSGYDNIPSSLPSGPLMESSPHPEIAYLRSIKIQLTNLGLTEVMNFPMVSEEMTGGETALKLSNTISKEWEFLRTSLIPGLSKTAVTNINYGIEPRIFEVGKIYQPKDGDLPYEKSVLTLIGENYSQVKGIFEAICTNIGLPSPTYESCQSTWLDSATSASARIESEVVGIIGVVSSTLRTMAGLHREMVVGEFDLDLLLAKIPTSKTFRSISKFPAVTEDLSVLVANTTPVGELVQAIKLFTEIATLSGVEATEIFADDKLGANKKSVKLTLKFQSPVKTLTSAEVKADRDKIAKFLKENFQAKIR